MKKIKRITSAIFLLIVFSSYVTVRVGMNDPNDASRYSYINTNLWINLTIKAK